MRKKENRLKTAAFVLSAGYDDSRAPSVEPQRRMLFFQKLDFYAENSMEKVLLINIDYSAVNRTLEKMNYDTDVFICQGDKIVLSNGRYSSIGKEFQTFDEAKEQCAALPILPVSVYVPCHLSSSGFFFKIPCIRTYFSV